MVERMNFQQISRRSFLKITGLTSTSALIFGVSGCSFSGVETIAIDDENTPSLFFEINDNQISFVLPRSEMGQGVATSFAMIVAEEMDYPLEQLQIKFAAADVRLGNQMTVGSGSVRSWWQKLREVGAGLKAVALDNAATHFSVSKQRCRVEGSKVYAEGVSEPVEYASLLTTESLQEFRGEAELKSPESFSVVGQTPKNKFIEEIVFGQPRYAGDVEPEDSLIAMTVAYKNDWSLPAQSELKELQSKHSLKTIFRLSGGLSGFTERVVMVGDSTWPVIKAKKALEQSLRGELRRDRSSQAEWAKSGYHQEMEKLGFVPEISENRIALAFSTAPVAQAPMETETAIAKFSNGNCVVWAPTQAPLQVKEDLSNYLDIDPEQVEVNTLPLGGGFGRKRYTDFVVEAAWIAKELAESEDGVPVKLMWSREDDLQREYYRTTTLQTMEWNSENPSLIHREQFKSGYPSDSVEVNETTDTFGFLGLNVESKETTLPGPYRPGIWRAVHYGYLGFSLNSFMDEISYAQGVDAASYFQNNLRKSGTLEGIKSVLKPGIGYQSERMENVIQTVRKSAGWDQAVKDGDAVGFAAYHLFYSYIAVVAKVNVKGHGLSIDKVWAAIDCGLPVNPDGIKAQVEGGINFGLSACLHSEIPVDKDFREINFDQYQVQRMPGAPEIDVEIIDSSFNPTGVGELGVPVIGPAVSNAIRRQIGVRFVKMPFLRDGQLNFNHAVKAT